MNRQIGGSVLVVLGLCILAALSCRQSELRTMTIDVPEMADARSVRIVTNAALDEVVGQYDGIKHDFEIDLPRQIILYHESQRLMSHQYRRNIESRVAEVGYQCKVLTARFNPPPPVETEDGPCQMWGDRFTAVISVPDMVSNTDANIVVDAISYARLGSDHPRVVTDVSDRRITATYESLLVAPESIEHAIACVGFSANEVPPLLDRPDAIPHGWMPIDLKM